MRTVAQTQKPNQQTESVNSITPGRASRRLISAVCPITHLHPAVGHRAVQPSPQDSEGVLNAGSATTVSTHFAHEFSRIPLHRKASIKIQERLTVSPLAVVHEHEADRVAEHVMRLPEPGFSCEQTCSGSGGCPKCKTTQTAMEQKQDQTKFNQASEAIAPSVVQEVLRSHGQPLDMKTRAFFEPRFGHDFSQVRIHTSDRAAQSAEVIGARAYTVGRRIVFGSQQYAPETTEGKQLLAHELAHAVQQGHSTSTPAIQARAIYRNFPDATFITLIINDAPETDTQELQEFISACREGIMLAAASLPIQGSRPIKVNIRYSSGRQQSNIVQEVQRLALQSLSGTQGETEPFAPQSSDAQRSLAVLVSGLLAIVHTINEMPQLQAVRQQIMRVVTDLQLRLTAESESLPPELIRTLAGLRATVEGLSLIITENPQFRETREVLSEFLLGSTIRNELFGGGQREYRYGPSHPWTQRLRFHPHMDRVRTHIREVLREYCRRQRGLSYREADLSSDDSFSLNNLNPNRTENIVENLEWLGRDTENWLSYGLGGQENAFLFGSFRLRWGVLGTPNCSDETLAYARVFFTASDTLRAGSGTRIPTSQEAIINDQPLGEGLPLNNVPITWFWTEDFFSTYR